MPLEWTHWRKELSEAGIFWLVSILDNSRPHYHCLHQHPRLNAREKSVGSSARRKQLPETECFNSDSVANDLNSAQESSLQNSDITSSTPVPFIRVSLSALPTSTHTHTGTLVIHTPYQSSSSPRPTQLTRQPWTLHEHIDTSIR